MCKHIIQINKNIKVANKRLELNKVQVEFSNHLHLHPTFHMTKEKIDNSVNLDIFGGEVYEEGLKWFWYTASVFDPFQQWQNDFPVVDTAADVLLLVVVRVHSITLGY